MKKNTKVSKQDVGSNPLDAIANGTLEGVKLAANIGGMLLVFVALIAMVNGILFHIGEFTTLNSWISNWSAYDALSIEAVLGTLFAPLMWLIGVPWSDLLPMGQLLGVKLAVSEFVGYIQLAELKNSANGIHFMHQKSIVMANLHALRVCKFCINWDSNWWHWRVGSQSTQGALKIWVSSGIGRYIGFAIVSNVGWVLYWANG